MIFMYLFFGRIIFVIKVQKWENIFSAMLYVVSMFFTNIKCSGSKNIYIYIKNDPLTTHGRCYNKRSSGRDDFGKVIFAINIIIHIFFFFKNYGEWI